MRGTCLIGALLLVLGSGCQVGPRYSVPCVSVPEEWKGSQEQCKCNTPGVCLWWEIFEDPVLSHLEEQAVANSPNLYVALARVVEARSMADVSRAAAFPHFALQPSYSQMDSLFKLYLPGGAGFPVATALRNDYRVNQFQYVMPFNLSYEIDLWGKIRSQYESALYSSEALEEAFYTALLTLTSDLAMGYFQLRSLDAQLDLLEATQRLRREALKLAQSRYDKGLANYTDVSNAQLQLSNVDSQYFDLLRQRVLQENALAVLLGMPASDFCLERQPLIAPPPCIPAGIPSDILLQRPDIAQAERDRASKHASVRVAYASFFPSLDLTMTLGFQSPELKQFLKWLSRLFALGLNSHQPLLDGGELSANLCAAWARFAQADGSYQQTVVTAFREVEDALVNLELQAKQSESLEQSVEAATQTTTLSQRRYVKGLVSYKEVIDSERSQLDAQRTLLSLLGVRYVATVQLIKALGGSWSCDVPLSN